MQGVQRARVGNLKTEAYDSFMAKKPKVTRTYGPIHFEDLDPHRFEDLVRELIYDYKDWQNIEATGRSGSDGGFDVRAWEKIKDTAQTSEGEDDQNTEKHPMDGNLWMIQGKREKEIGPKRVEEILEEIDSKNPPYGYILAASANFSKESYDVFRSKLREKGVMEFYLWGKAELEDMLHLPKNDRILFTFFGISLVSRRRSRATEIRFVVNNKNKLYRIFGEKISGRQHILLRDSKDTKYPFKKEYKDFKDNPRWREYPLSEYYPLGLIFDVRKYFAYVDTVKKEYDIADSLSLIHRESDSEEDRARQDDERTKIEDFWHHLPRATQGTYVKDGLVRYDEMLVVDDKGDNWHKFPHIFVDFEGPSGPFSGYLEYIEIDANKIYLKGFKRIKVFPKKFSEPKLGKLHKDKEVQLENHFLYRIKHHSEGFHTLYETDGRLSFMKARDAYAVSDPENASSKNYIVITRIASMKVKDYLAHDPEKKYAIHEQLGREPDSGEMLNIYEFRHTYDFVYDRDRQRLLKKKPPKKGAA